MRGFQTQRAKVVRDPNYWPTRHRLDPRILDEVKCKGVMNALGFRVTKRGWPDFFCIHPDTREVVFVEVKNGPKDRPTKYQRFVLAALSSFGIPCYVWTQQTGFVKAKPYGNPVKPGRMVERGEDSKPF